MTAGKKRGAAGILVFSALVSIAGLAVILLMQALAGMAKDDDIRELASLADMREPIELLGSPFSRDLRLYRWGSGRYLRYGSVLSAGGPGSSALVSVAVSRRGVIEGIGFVSAANPRHAASDPAYLAPFVGGAALEAPGKVDALAGRAGMDARDHGFLRSFALQLRAVGSLIDKAEQGRGP